MDQHYRRSVIKKRLQNKIGSNKGLTIIEKIILDDSDFFTKNKVRRGLMPSLNELTAAEHLGEEMRIKTIGVLLEKQNNESIFRNC